VAFNVFKNDNTSKVCLERWRKQCLSKPRRGNLGDQKYLDEWPNLYRGSLVISENVGIDAAPWNISQYKVTMKGSIPYINGDKLVCYHFHQFQILGPGRFNRALGFSFSDEVVEDIYKPYEEEMKSQYLKIRNFDPDFLIFKTKQNLGMLLRHKLAKYFGPTYWWIKNLLD
jgi:hypothetical protein